MDTTSGWGARLSPPSWINWGIAQATVPGESISGDRYLVVGRPDGALIAVVDGLGHGIEAAQAADAALITIETHMLEPVTLIVKRCHEAMRRTRGAVMSLAAFSMAAQSMTWLGVGNVEGVLLRADKHASPARENVCLFPGVVGYHLPPVRAAATHLNPGDTVIFFTDGIREDFLSEPRLGQSPQLIAYGICRKHCKGTDDALVLVARWCEGVNPPVTMSKSLA